MLALAGIEGLELGCVAVVNRNVNARITTPYTLEEQLAVEQKWFRGSGMSVAHADHKNFLQQPLSQAGDEDWEHPLPELSELGRKRLGLPALLDKIDLVFRQHLNKEYVPSKIQEQQVYLNGLLAQMLALGTDPAKLTLNQLFDHAYELLTPVLTPNHAEAMCNEAVDLFHVAEAKADLTTFETVLHFKELKHKLWENLCLFPLFSGNSSNGQPCLLLKLMSDKVANSFSSDTESNIQLHRFPLFQLLLCRSLERRMQAVVEEFVTETQETLTQLFRRFRSDPSNHADLLKKALISCMLEFLVVPSLEKGRVQPGPECTDSPEQRADLPTQQYFQFMADQWEECRKACGPQGKSLPEDADTAHQRTGLF